jgi:cold shock protein
MSEAPAGREATGRVKWFNVDKGFGFITSDDGLDCFVHWRMLVYEGGEQFGRKRTINAGERVAFRIVDTPRGPEAHAVKRLNK